MYEKIMPHFKQDVIPVHISPLLHLQVYLAIRGGYVPVEFGICDYQTVIFAVFPCFLVREYQDRE